MQGLLAFQRYFDFSGRSARAEYWQFMGIYVLALAVAYVLDLALSGPYGTPTLTVLVVLICIVPAYTASVRRLHDRGRTGRWIIAHIALTVTALVLIAAVARTRYTTTGDLLQTISRIVGLCNLGLSVFLLFELVRRGYGGSNEYGADPLMHPADAPTLAKLTDWAHQARAGAPKTPTPSPLTASTHDPLDQIERLAKLRDAGLLTAEEYDQKKAAYLARL